MVGHWCHAGRVLPSARPAPPRLAGWVSARRRRSPARRSAVHVDRPGDRARGNRPRPRVLESRTTARERDRPPGRVMAEEATGVPPAVPQRPGHCRTLSLRQSIYALWIRPVAATGLLLQAHVRGLRPEHGPAMPAMRRSTLSPVEQPAIGPGPAMPAMCRSTASPVERPELGHGPAMPAMRRSTASPVGRPERAAPDTCSQ